MYLSQLSIDLNYRGKTSENKLYFQSSGYSVIFETFV